MACASVACASVLVCKIAVAKKRMLAIARGISTERATCKGFPESILSANAKASRSRSINPANFNISEERSCAVVADHEGNACFAASTASCTSSDELAASSL